MCTQSWYVKTPIPNGILQVLQKEEDVQAHLNYKPSDNTLDNANSNDTVEDNNLNDILMMDCEHKFTIRNSLFQINEEDKYACGLCTRISHIQREQITSGNSLSNRERMVSIRNLILRPMISRIMSPYQYLASTEDVAIREKCYAS